MKKRMIFLIVLASQCAFAQQNQIAKFFPAAAVPSGGAANVQGLVAGFIRPIGEDFGALANNGWYSTAENHKKWGFDLQVTMNTIFANSDTKTFPTPALNTLTYLGTTSGSTAPAPTAYGAETEIPRYRFDAGLNSPLQFIGPGGGNISKDVPVGSLVVPTITGGIGLFANTDIRFRYTPNVKFGDTELKNWGVGIMHDIKQHIPGIKMAPFSLSLLLAYSQLTATTNLGGLYGTSVSSPTSYSGQEGIGETKGYTAQILVSKSLSVITFYAGIGYNSSTTTYDITGSYYVDKASIGGGATVPLLAPVTLTNPFHQDFTVSGFRATGGIRFKLGPILLNGDYTSLTGKGMLTAGFGFTVH
ncbi:hypothetical protein BH09BAC3_BH09BAC3_18010 [soil metagenome]